MSNKGHLLMNQQERDRKALMEAVKSGHISLKAAGQRMGLSYRQTKRVWRRFQSEGDIGLIHKSRGRGSNRSCPSDYKAKILSRYQEQYLGFGPTFASEKLQEEDLPVNAETLRLWLLAAGLWEPRRKRKHNYQRRERRQQFGELLQLDGSIHHWFGPDGEYQCLMVLIDDATGIRLAHMASGETLEATLQILKEWIEAYGIPQAIYVDLKTVYVSPKGSLTIEEELKGKEPGSSVFEQVCKRLGIEIIKAYSPQAKGRVERCHGVYQDRLVKEIGLNGFTSIEEVNAFLKSGFTEGLNDKFAISPAKESDGHVSLQSNQSLNELLRREYKRQVQNDLVVQFRNEVYQITGKPGHVVPKQDICVQVLFDGTIRLVSEGQNLEYRKLEEKPKRKEKPKEKMTPGQLSQKSRKSAKNSPWSQYNPGWLKGSQRKTETVP